MDRHLIRLYAARCFSQAGSIIDATRKQNEAEKAKPFAATGSSVGSKTSSAASAKPAPHGVTTSSKAALKPATSTAKPESGKSADTSFHKVAWGSASNGPHKNMKTAALVSNELNQKKPTSLNAAIAGANKNKAVAASAAATKNSKQTPTANQAQQASKKVNAQPAASPHDAKWAASHPKKAAEERAKAHPKAAAAQQNNKNKATAAPKKPTANKATTPAASSTATMKHDATWAAAHPKMAAASSSNPKHDAKWVAAHPKKAAEEWSKVSSPHLVFSRLPFRLRSAPFTHAPSLHTTRHTLRRRQRAACTICYWRASMRIAPTRCPT